jgi:hypothetical protein
MPVESLQTQRSAPFQALALKTPNTEQAHLNISFICIKTAFYYLF